METINANELIGVADLGCATAIACYFPVEYLDRQNPNRVQFCFKRDKSIERITEQFWKGTLMINAVAYYNAFKLLKARLRNEK
ncbi:MAG: DUF5659 domain-containing protein [Candidatus Peregrinibacteria bacterium]|nr:DUF5659 domain-containing protein [Candidatus Peregrinibacteria bacterium]